ncbi:MAG: hypothetical protein AAF242_12075 [Bacteroidota bacterium]
MDKKEKKEKDLDVHKDLSGFNIKINEFGEITSSLEIDQLNSFLNENVVDKKLQEREEALKAEEEE